MPEQRDVKVFISWSGDLAKEVALALREWLPLLFDRVEPWASERDVEAGQRGLNEIESELAGTRFGIVVVTAENQFASWLNFEAGALSRTVSDENEHRVVPLLVDMNAISDLEGPLSQFQAKIANRDGVLGLLQSLGAVAGIPAGVVASRFDLGWPQLEARLIESKENAAQRPSATPPRRQQAAVLDEVLQHVRAIRAETDLSRPAWERQLTATPSAHAQSGETPQQHVWRLVEANGFRVVQHKFTFGGGLTITVAPLEGNSADGAEPLAESLRRWFAPLALDIVPS